MIVDLTNEPVTRILVNQTRLKVTESTRLAQAHREVGRLLAKPFAERLTLEEYDIEHVTGPSKGVRVASGREPIILALLRAGLFLAEGIRESFPESSLILIEPGQVNIPQIPAFGRPLLLVDGVINSGKSIRPLIESALARRASKVVVAALVAHRDGVEDLSRDFPTVDFIIARISEHSYVGKGGTDTGARLFGTTSWATERH